MVPLHEVFVFLEPGTDPSSTRVRHHHDGVDTSLVWAPDARSAAHVVDEEVAAGVGLVELYRGFDLVAAGAVIEAVGGRAAVGVAGYGHGSTITGRISRSVTIYSSPAGDPALERVVQDHPGGGRTTVVGAPDAEAATAVALELADDGVDLIEICGGTPLTTAARVQAALGGRVPVSLVSYPFESIDPVAAYKASFEAAER